MSEHEENHEESTPEEINDQQEEMASDDATEESVSDESGEGVTSAVEEQETISEEERPEQNEELVEAVQSASVPSVSSQEFKQQLTDFFTEHNPKKVKFAQKIADRFMGQEETVLAHLRENYSHGNKPKKEWEPSGKKSADSSKGSKTKAVKAGKSGGAAKPKSKKMMMIIIIAVVVIALGVVGFLFKDKIMGMIGGEPAAPEEPVSSTPVEEAQPPVEETVPEEPIALADSAASDSTAVADSAAVDTTAAPEGDTE